MWSLRIPTIAWLPALIQTIYVFLRTTLSRKLGKAREAAIEFLKIAIPEDEFFLVSFNERVELTTSFTNSVEDLQSRLMFTSSKDGTALLDAIYPGLSQMRRAHNAILVTRTIRENDEH